MKFSQWLITGMGSVISGVTVWYAFNGEVPEDLGTVIAGTLLAVGCFTWAFVGLEDNKKVGSDES